MRLFWIILLLAGLMVAGAFISFIGKILFYIAGFALILLLLFYERRRRRRINKP